jgi:hypothetical protein
MAGLPGEVLLRRRGRYCAKESLFGVFFLAMGIHIAVLARTFGIRRGMGQVPQKLRSTRTESCDCPAFDSRSGG